MWAYWDTSAMAKRYAEEAGSDSVRHLLSRYECLSSQLLPLELKSALRRRRDAGAVSAEQWQAAIGRVASDRRYWRLHEVSSEVLRQAEVAIGEYRIRSLDAIHLATAKILRQRLPGALSFVTADRRQAEAATVLGLEVQLIAAD